MNKVLQSALAGIAFLTLAFTPAPAGDDENMLSAMDDIPALPVEKPVARMFVPHRAVPPAAAPRRGLRSGV